MMTGRTRKSGIGCNDRCLKGFGKSQIGSVEYRNIRSKRPDALYERQMRIARHIKGRKVLQRFPSAKTGQLTPQRSAPERLQNLDIEEVRDVECLAGPE
jgi:hypothetical protein